MTETYRLYLRIIDGLRERRSRKEWQPGEDRDELAALEDLFERLTPEEQKLANSEGWRSWPDLYDAHMEETLVEPAQLVPDDRGPARRAA